ncbi:MULTISPECIES: 30S ribosomal protein S3ae [unclassified Methanoregula]|uniref:30S ribosomal protein S3ae n=1 Tax=unclassified Methanoregula TaxID=2649730 RepID=UPI0009D19603|nr:MULTISPECIES: 30S ribosomal protein S3ae [unclassified Methanoregula]OPX64071.1 MAG: 30S ribosomal protein S3Ae [Methanoregula sp. PtaB.Bin085]OPY33731.1 MAG: 30S ribosomal protein S3Ae [Methanoregula sp. PtaU1.Bin006]
MAKKKQVGRRVEGWKAKSWFKVHTPDTLGKVYIGDTIANDAESAVGRIMTATLGEIVNDYAKQHMKMSFRIATVTGDAAYTDFVGHEVTRDYLRSLVKRRSSRIDTVVPVTTKDGKKVRLTICTYTFARANLSQEHAIRNAILQAVAAQGQAWDLTALLNGIVSGEISRDLFKAVKTIYPTRRVEIIKSKVEPIAAPVDTT